MTASTSGRLHLIEFGAFCLVYAVTVFYALRTFGMSGNIYGSAIATLFASTLPMFAVGHVMEGRNYSEIFDLSRGSWAFILGDALALPLVAGASAAVWSRLDSDGWYTSGLWVVVSLLLGSIASTAFHLMDAGVYSNDRLYSPTKIVHDFVAYPVLFSALTLLAVPAVMYGWGNGAMFGSILVIVGVLAWVWS